ncbi:flavodoxin [Leptotrichia hongkongensis]|uniref:flavodoxin n=1 Tax=Leptotrichia hongkongensis TaxID=554406 RepID=UPI0035A84FE8
MKVKIKIGKEEIEKMMENSRVNREHDNPNSRNVELKNAIIPDFSSYDTVFIGYPIWWREASWVLGDFVKKNDFTGKTVIPFGTSMSTGDGTSGNRLKKLTKTGNWVDGQRFSSSYNESEVVDWVKSLKY